MGQEDEEAQRVSDLKPYAVTAKLFAAAKPDALFMHCLPAHAGEEVEQAVLDNPRSIIFDQAENRFAYAKGHQWRRLREKIGAGFLTANGRELTRIGLWNRMKC